MTDDVSTPEVEPEEPILPSQQQAALDVPFVRHFLQVSRAYSEQRLRVRVVDENGLPVQRAAVVAEVPGLEPDEPLEVDDAATDDEGRAEFALGKTFGAQGKLDEERHQLIPEVDARFADSGTDRWSGDGFTVSPTRDRFGVFPQGKEAAIHALRRTDWHQVRSDAELVINAEQVIEQIVERGGEVDPEFRKQVDEAERLSFESVVLALAGSETGALLEFGFNSNSLHAYVRERVNAQVAKARLEKRPLPDPQEALPASWKGVIEVGERPKISVVKSGK